MAVLSILNNLFKVQIQAIKSHFWYLKIKNKVSKEKTNKHTIKKSVSTQTNNLDS